MGVGSVPQAGPAPPPRWGPLHAALAPLHEDSHSPVAGRPVLLLHRPPRCLSELASALGAPRERAPGCSAQHSPGGVPFCSGGCRGDGQREGFFERLYFMVQENSLMTGGLFP